MDITFSIEYKAQWGQKLCVTGSIVELGNWDEGENAIELMATSDDTWQGTVSIDGRRKDFVYYYFVRNENHVVERREWKRMHHLLVTEPVKKLLIDDRWIDRPANSPFYSSSFYDVLFRHDCEHSPKVKRTKENEKIHFQIYAPTVPRNMRVYLSGSTQKLGLWDPHQAMPMHYMGKGEWIVTAEVSPTSSNTEVEFKFFIADEDLANIRWETSPNRTFKLKPHNEYDATYVVGLSFEEEDYQPHFAGIVVPLFSVRSDNDWGVGDFGSLHKMISWANEINIHILQMLPINDTTFYRDERDSYPYNCVSVNAINPIYIDINALLPLKRSEEQESFNARAVVLNKLDSLDYEAVYKLKEEYLRAHYRDHASSVMKKRPYRDFCLENGYWLYPYVAYCILRDKYPNQSPHNWKIKQVIHPISESSLRNFVDKAENKEEAYFYKYVQFLLHGQLSDVSNYAAEKGVLLKGDIPIGVSPNGVDAWVHSELFHTDQQAGAPPDDFAIDGQNWGFPTYNWQTGENDEFKWWKNRFKFMSNYFHAFRIDHILGFFRIWEIPIQQRSGLLGHFNPAIPYSASDIENAGLTIPHAFWTMPLIHKNDATTLFGQNVKALIWDGLLTVVPETDFYSLKYTDQKELEGLDNSQIPGGDIIKQALIKACTEVLFVTDPQNDAMFHPRVSITNSLIFNRLEKSNQDILVNLSNDFFFKRNDELWKVSALKKLIPMHRSTDMLVCAEDLGMIPQSVPEVLSKLQVLSLELERMPKHETENGWADIYNLPYYSVCTTSTHDIPPLRLWWQSLDTKKQDEYKTLYLTGLNNDLEGYEHEDALYRNIVYHHLKSSSMLVILPIADWMAIDHRLQIQSPEQEQINHPEISSFVWNYRTPVTIESLRNDYPDFNNQIKQLLERTLRD